MGHCFYTVASTRSRAPRFARRSSRWRSRWACTTTATGTRAWHMQITSSVETLLGLLGAPGAESEFSLPISSKSVERWACDSTLSRVLLQDSIPIDVGRGNRVIKGAKRRALIARDQHCQWPGCERPASGCDGHHLKHWIDGGSTN